MNKNDLLIYDNHYYVDIILQRSLMLYEYNSQCFNIQNSFSHTFSTEHVKDVIEQDVSIISSILNIDKSNGLILLQKESWNKVMLLEKFLTDANFKQDLFTPTNELKTKFKCAICLIKKKRESKRIE